MTYGRLFGLVAEHKIGPYSGASLDGAGTRY